MKKTRMTTTATSSDPRRTAANCIRHRGGGVQVVGREINEVVWRTWKPDTYGPVSTSLPGIHASLVRQTEMAVRRQMRDKYRNHTWQLRTDGTCPSAITIRFLHFPPSFFCRLDIETLVTILVVLNVYSFFSVSTLIFPSCSYTFVS